MTTLATAPSDRAAVHAASAIVANRDRLFADPRIAAIVERASAILGDELADPMLFVQAFVHKSYLNEHPDFPIASNERLEFLGDSVFGLIATEHLYHGYPTLDEGGLTWLRSAIVRAETIARWAQSLGLGAVAILGRGLASEGGRARATILANLYEAFVGAIALAHGHAAARRFVLGHVETEAQRVLRDRTTKDSKTRLQELAQAQFQLTPVYRIIGSEGQADARLFRVEVRLGDFAAAEATARNKQLASQRAADLALERWPVWTAPGGTPPWQNRT